MSAMTRATWCALALAAALAWTAGPAAAQACDARQVAGYRVLTLEGARRIAVWYPAAGVEAERAYARSAHGFVGRVAHDASPARCTALPLVVFSHGFGGCGLQSIFFTEELARHGYVVAAPDHKDAAMCAINEESVGSLRAPDAPFQAPKRWSDQSHSDRRDDVLATIAAIVGDPRLGGLVDASRIGLAGHSLGGYTALGMVGGWPSWRDPRVKAVLAFSPYAAPFLEQGTLATLRVPVMYQGAQFDWGVTPLLEGPRGAYARSSAPRYFLKLRGGTHFEWTNLVCLGEHDTESCLRSRPNAYRIDRYGIEFLDRWLKGRASTLLQHPASGVESWLFDES
jgi:predicted dienelactone hydrolase